MRFYFSYFYEFLTTGLLIAVLGIFLFLLPELLDLVLYSFRNLSIFDFLYKDENNVILIRAVGIVLIIISLIYSYLKFKFSFLDLMDDFLYYEEGIIAKVRKKIPYKNITDIQLRRGILDSILGLESIYINTAGKSDYELIIKGLSIEHGDIILQKLKNKMKKE